MRLLNLFVGLIFHLFSPLIPILFKPERIESSKCTKKIVYPPIYNNKEKF